MSIRVAAIRTIELQAGRRPPCFEYNKRLLRQKTGGACLYMPQDGHWLASFEVIPRERFQLGLVGLALLEGLRHGLEPCQGLASRQVLCWICLF